jgi:hypothetical protein
VIVYALCGIPNSHAQPADSSAVYLFPRESPVSNIAVWKVISGDSASWRLPAYDDSKWSSEAAGKLWASDPTGGKGIRWYRQTIFIPEPFDSLQACALYCKAAVSASEFYWDGFLIAQNGRIARGNMPEISGRSAQFIIVPQHLTAPGRHVAALCVGNTRAFSGLLESPLEIGYASSLLSAMTKTQTVLLLCAGIFLIAGLFHFAVMVGKARGPAYALFGVLSLSCAAYLLIDASVNYFHAELSQYYTLALINDIPWFLMMALLPIFFLYEFSVSFRLRASAVIAVAALACIVPARLITFGLVPVAWLGGLELVNRFYMYAVTILAAAIALVNIVRRQKGALLGFAGCGALLAGIYASFQLHKEYAWALGFCGLIVLLTLSLSRQMAQQNRRRQEMELRGARLELELLKKHIQPHFLLNSLNSVIAWLEENPPTAVRLVTALAEELRLILQFSSAQRIPVSEELRLCNLHLQVMGLRHDRAYTLASDPVPNNEFIPPLVIHTLVENGLTHGCRDSQGQAFVFRRETETGLLRYVVFNSGATDGATVPQSEGTGIRYVKTRLEEAFPGAWRLTGGPCNSGWETRIEILRKGTKP